MKIKKIDLIYFCAIGIILVNYYLGISNLIEWSEDISDFFNLIAYVLLFLKIIYKESIMKLILYGVIIILSLCGYLNSGMTVLITLILVVIASKNIDLNRIIIFIFSISLVTLLVHIFLYIFNLIFSPDSLEIIYRYDRPRYNFYLGHPNNFGAIVAWTTLMYFYLKYEKINVWDNLIGILIALFLYVVPNSRTSAMLIIITLILMFLYKKDFKIIINFSKITIPVSFIAILFFSITYDVNPFSEQLDKFFSSRIRLGAAIYENYGIHLLGESIPVGELVTNSYKYGLTALTVDSAYQSLIFFYGIINSFIFLVAYTYLNFKKGIEIKKILFLTVWALFAITESMALNPLICFPLLFITDLINPRKKGEKYEN